MTPNDQMTLEIRLTQPGFDLLHAELAHLVEVSRPDALRRVHGAYESGGGDGDSEISDARWEQDRIEARIRRLEEQLRTARLITDVELRSDRVALGHRVDVRRAGGRERRYVLVTPLEGDPRTGRLSSGSPLGRALLGGAVGDVVVLDGTGEEITIVAIASGDDREARGASG